MVILGKTSITELNILNPLSIENGGTGATTADEALTNLGVKAYVKSLSASGTTITYTLGNSTSQTLSTVQGTQGNIGSQGPRGAQGATGAQGARGAQGATGAQGGTGARGAQGSVGTASTTQGTRGAQGATGSQGGDGPRGAQGATGSQGGTGARGAQGSVGTASTTQGPRGKQGTQGSQGTANTTQGTQGAQGAQGGTGTSANYLLNGEINYSTYYVSEFGDYITIEVRASYHCMNIVILIIDTDIPQITIDFQNQLANYNYCYTLYIFNWTGTPCSVYREASGVDMRVQYTSTDIQPNHVCCFVHHNGADYANTSEITNLYDNDNVGY